jgi:carboxylesterase type B
MHQLTAFGGKEPALFKRAVVQSAAYDVWVDRKGDLEQKFQDLLKVAGCTGKGLACLRALDYPAMKAAQDKYIAVQPTGKFGFGLAYTIDSLKSQEANFNAGQRLTATLCVNSQHSSSRQATLQRTSSP